MTYDIIIVGSICNMDIAWADAITKRGLKCAIVRMPDDPAPDFSTLPGPVRYFSERDILTNEGPVWFLRQTAGALAVVSITGHVTRHLRPLWQL